MTGHGGQFINLRAAGTVTDLPAEPLPTLADLLAQLQADCPTRWARCAKFGGRRMKRAPLCTPATGCTPSAPTATHAPLAAAPITESTP